jgi:hypothetical protein
VKKSDAQKWLETVDMEEVEPHYRPMLEYFKKLMSGKLPSEIRGEVNE